MAGSSQMEGSPFLQDGPTKAWTPAHGWAAEVGPSEYGYGVIEIDAQPPIDAPEAVVDGAVGPTSGAEEFVGATLVTESDFAAWAHRQTAARRAAGHRGSWEGRRDMRGRTFAERDRQGFVGRYRGSCKVTPQMLDAELAPVYDPDDLEQR